MTSPTPSITPSERSHEPLPFAGQLIHFAGIGGCGMSGLARLLQSLGADISGSDPVTSAITDALATDGVAFSAVQDGSAIPSQCTCVVTSAALPPDHPELLCAAELGLPVITYAQMLGRTQANRTGISIAGTHGKSTTSAMLGHILISNGIDPGFIIGANCRQIGGGSRVGAAIIPGDGPYAGRPGVLIAEACEFQRSFHHHAPVMGLINNIEEDHLDIYGSLDSIIDAFGGFAKLLPDADDGGYLLIAHDGAHRTHVTTGVTCKVETFGFHPDADYQVIYDPAVQRVGILRQGHWVTQWTNPMPGSHNALNAAAAALLASKFPVAWEGIAESLQRFAGIDRRMQRLGTRAVNGGEVIVYDDYAHHPTEIEKTLKALRDAESPKRVICVFQPHQHSRTRFLMDQFARSFSAADEVIVPEIYFVRDSHTERQSVSAADLVERLGEMGTTARHIPRFDDIVTALGTTCRGGDLLVIMGAGPVDAIARRFLGQTS